MMLKMGPICPSLWRSFVGNWNLLLQRLMTIWFFKKWRYIILSFLGSILSIVKKFINIFSIVKQFIYKQDIKILIEHFIYNNFAFVTVVFHKF